MGVVERIADMFTGWELTLKKRSAQLAILTTAWETFITAAPDVLPQWLSGTLTLGLLGMTVLASNATQNSVASYDPTKFKLVPIGGS